MVALVSEEEADAKRNMEEKLLHLGASVGGLGMADLASRNSLDCEVFSFLHFTLQCKSNDDDLGKHDLSFQSNFHWEFKSNSLFPNTLFYCNMWWQNVYGSFDVYKAQRDDNRCASKCWWRIKQTGAFSYDETKDRWDLVYIWQNYHL
ncbi:hypothetical protein DVH24_012022 [Malus domestica]|uniref:S-protein homolog n=1 Tax=Malus domestica TaxID=3750 RepID=A0A498HLE9_MALDO|nr:hypothetical protein DVH24_012022 [Malus domestica]